MNDSGVINWIDSLKKDCTEEYLSYAKGIWDQISPYTDNLPALWLCGDKTIQFTWQTKQKLLQLDVVNDLEWFYKENADGFCRFGSGIPSFTAELARF